MSSFKSAFAGKVDSFFRRSPAKKTAPLACHDLAFGVDPAEDISLFVQVDVVFTQKRAEAIALAAVNAIRGIYILGEGQVVGQRALPGKQCQSMDGIFRDVIHPL